MEGPLPLPLVTLRFAVPLTGPNAAAVVAVMDVVPEPTDVARPDALIVAVAGVLDAQVTELVMSRVSEGCLP